MSENAKADFSALEKKGRVIELGDKNYETGYKDGQTDKSSGKGKSTFARPVKRALKPDSFLPGGKNRVEEYLDGYQKGYQDETRTINVDNVKGNTAMRREEEQLELLNSLHSHLQLLDANLQAASNEYERIIEQLADAGLSGNRFDYLNRNAVVPTVEILKKIILRINEVDMDIVRKDMLRVQSLIDDYNT